MTFPYTCFAPSVFLTGYTADQIPAMTSNTAPSGTASASSSFDATYQPWKAMDNDPTGALSCWLTGTTTAAWIKYQFTSAKRIERYTITGCKNSTQDAQAPGDAPRAWTFEGSNDDTNWTVLDTRTAQVFADTNEKKTYDCTNVNSYLYYRLNITAVTSGTRIGVAEFEMMEGVYT